MFQSSQGSIFGPPTTQFQNSAGSDQQMVQIPLSQYKELIETVEKGRWNERLSRSEASTKEMALKAEYGRYARITRNLLHQLQKISQTAHNPAQFYSHHLLEAGVSITEAEKLGADPVNADNWAYVSDHFQSILEKSKSQESEKQDVENKLAEARKRILELEDLVSAARSDR